MRSPIYLLTPGQIARSSKYVAIVTAIALGCGYVSNTLSPASAAIGSFALATVLLLAAPTQRASEMLGAVAVWISFAEFLSTMQTGHFSGWRLAVAVAALGCVMTVIRVQHLRDLSRQAPDTALGDLDRRTASGFSAIPHSSAELVQMRSTDTALSVAAQFTEKG